MSVYDIVAPTFDRDRGIPDVALEAVRTETLSAVAPLTRPRILDLGAGTGRIGLPFAAARDDYVGVDLSLGMLRRFAERAESRICNLPQLVQADGQHLPFRHAAFDVVMLIQVFGGLHGWRQVLAEVKRVLRPRGLVLVGQSTRPPAGIDAQLKWKLSNILDGLGIRSDQRNVRDEVLRALLAVSEVDIRIVAAQWDAELTPNRFINRHQKGAFFSKLPPPIKEQALHQLRAWAIKKFTSLDAAFHERHSFELRIFRFREKGAVHG
jgi:ubiquinone/menaquinone biosynthesis C-methylase UbiE